MSFDEERLDLGIVYGTTTTLTYDTTILVDGGGREQRNPNWEQPLLKFELGDRYLNQSELDYLNLFHAWRRGSYRGFRYKDWSDYKGVRQNAVLMEPSVYQLAKTYSIGTYSVMRPIHKPVVGTVRVYVDGLEWTSGWSVNTSRGVVTFTNSLPNGAVVTADFEFDVPVRFEQDKLEARLEAHNRNIPDKIFLLQKLTLVEIKFLSITTTPVPQSLNHTIDLGIDLRTVGGHSFDTSILTTGANFETRSPNWISSRGEYNIGDRSLHRKDLDYLISLFRICRGAATRFKFYDWQSDGSIPVRFGSDSLSYRFDAIEVATDKAIFYLPGFMLSELAQPTTITQTFSQTFDPDAITTHSFTIAAPDEVVEWGDAEIYLDIGDWDDCGSIGSYIAPCNIGQTASIVCNLPLLIGTGFSVSGTVENLGTGGCAVFVELLWKKI